MTAGEQVDALGDERAAFRVDGDGADLTAFGLGLADVEVAQWSGADRAAVLGLLTHLVLDVRAARLRLVLVNRVDDRLHHRALGAFAHVEDGGDDAGTDLLEVALGDASVDAVPKDAIEVVDDHIVDVFLSLDPGDHLLELGPLVDACSRPTRLNELVNDIGVQRVGFTRACFTLSRDGDSLGVVVRYGFAPVLIREGRERLAYVASCLPQNLVALVLACFLDKFTTKHDDNLSDEVSVYVIELVSVGAHLPFGPPGFHTLAPPWILSMWVVYAKKGHPVLMLRSLNRPMRNFACFHGVECVRLTARG